MADAPAGESQQSSLSEVFDVSSKPATEPVATASEDNKENLLDKDESKPEGTEKSDDKSTPEKDDKSKEKPLEPEKTSDKSKKDDVEKKGDEKKTLASEEEKVAIEKAAKEKWESEENPFFKRFRDASAYANREHQENLQLKQQVTKLSQDMQILQKKADGTYDPEKDDPVKQIRPEDVATQALNVGKMLASKNAMVAQHGAEKVNATLDEFTQTFGDNEMIQAVVLGSESPVSEAFRILDRYKFEQKYGTSPDDWRKNLRTEIEAELRPAIEKEVTDKLMQRADKKKNTPQGLSSARGSNGLDNPQNSDEGSFTPLEKIF